jgi:hypothetical protein
MAPKLDYFAVASQGGDCARELSLFNDALHKTVQRFRRCAEKPLVAGSTSWNPKSGLATFVVPEGCAAEGPALA